ncbi:RNA polymerase sigma factor SigJ [Hazenella sp. IB182357]|uniref:RNA polymerase sigma factor SigJ n=1 Tax=Polycladospora coralii TaxID=2771432 RepID=A0A926RT51_9BACL|nr:RNA polymerase sigma factor SigJ [Polycladospora coralii]MBD1371248.1 RNA polymerase sigma factor SigJ [Polycladospora coralii]
MKNENMTGLELGKEEKTIHTIENMYQAYYPLLFSIGYRMTGSVMDTEDLIQDTIFKAIQSVEWKVIENKQAYLCKMLSRRCLDYLKSATKQRETYIGEWLPEPILYNESNDFPEQKLEEKESIGFAYLHMLEKLTATERVVFLLREVFQHEYQEIADVVNKSEVNCRKVYSRAKAKLHNIERDPLIDHRQNQQLIHQFISALNIGDEIKLSQLLADDVVIYSDGGGKVMAATRPINNLSRVLPFLLGIVRKTRDYTYEIKVINGQPGVLFFRDEQLVSVCQYTWINQQIKQLHFLLNPDKLRYIATQLETSKFI